MCSDSVPSPSQKQFPPPSPQYHVFFFSSLDLLFFFPPGGKKKTKIKTKKKTKKNLKRLGGWGKQRKDVIQTGQWCSAMNDKEKFFTIGHIPLTKKKKNYFFSFTFISRHGFQTTMPLAHGLDSLVRVSRRVEQHLTLLSDISSVHNTTKIVSSGFDLGASQSHKIPFLFSLQPERRKEKKKKPFCMMSHQNFFTKERRTLSHTLIWMLLPQSMT